MSFAPQGDAVEAGISLFQKDDNYINCTVSRSQGTWVLSLVLAKPGAAPKVLKAATLADYQGEISLKVESHHHQYHFEYAVGRAVAFAPLASTGADHLLSRGYTGAYLGLYCSSQGKPPKGAFADFDWVRHIAMRHSEGHCPDMRG
mmetsp:Transcript_82634/g.192002  ORF Transcript_82634/g.192002 Transcript_82634/m.192002 type:complete len:146 (+) Transcript_82634:892-1329(+)